MQISADPPVSSVCFEDREGRFCEVPLFSFAFDSGLCIPHISLFKIFDFLQTVLCIILDFL